MKTMTRPILILSAMVLVILILGFAVNGCSPDTEAKYKGKIRAKIINYEIIGNEIVITYNLGDTQIADELDNISDTFFWILAKRQGEEVSFNIEAKASSGGG